MIKQYYTGKKRKGWSRTLQVVTLLLLSTMSLALPREFYDPHPGVEYDIFCRNYIMFMVDEYRFRVELTAEEEPLPQDEYGEHLVILFLVLLRYSRAPPVPPVRKETA